MIYFLYLQLYDGHGSNMRLSVSADANCRGLGLPMGAALIMDCQEGRRGNLEVLGYTSFKEQSKVVRRD